MMSNRLLVAQGKSFGDTLVNGEVNNLDITQPNMLEEVEC